MSTKRPWFYGRKFIITGGTTGIGFEITKRFLEAGAKALIISHSKEELEDAKGKLHNFDDKLETFQCDVSKYEDVEKFAKYVEAQKDKDFLYGGLIECVGITNFGPFFESQLKDLIYIIRVNIEGTVTVTHQILPKVLEKNGKEMTYLTFISSVAALAEFPYFGLYSATKVAMEHFFNSLSKELPKTVKLLMIRPGAVKTRFYERAKNAPGHDMRILAEKTKSYFTTPDKVAKTFVNAIIKKKTGIIYPSFSTKLQASLLTNRLIGPFLKKSYFKQIMTYNK